MKHALIALCCLLAAIPRAARAAQLGVEAGYVRGECALLDAAAGGSARTCFSGGRAAALFNFYEKEKDDDAATPAQDRGHTSWGGSFWRGGSQGGRSHHGAGGAQAEAFVVVVAVLVVFGVIWGVAALASSQLKIGVVHSEDFQRTSWGGDKDSVLQRYDVQRTGLQSSFHLISGSNFELHTALAGARAQIRTTSADGEAKSYHLRGLASTIGLGWAPAAGSGPTFNYEFEGTYFADGNLANYLRETNSKILPRYRHSGALMLGYVQGF